MAKSKNHTNHNQSRKAQTRGIDACTDKTSRLGLKQLDSRNGIKRPQKNRYAGMKGVDPKFKRNQRFATQGSIRAVKEFKASKMQTE